jgi:hypothetical protein
MMVREEGVSPMSEAAPDEVEAVPEATCQDPAFLAVIDGLSSLETSVNATGADTPRDHLADLRNCILVIQQRAAALRQRIDQSFMTSIDTHGPIEVGSVRYVVTVDRTTRCRDSVATAECVLDGVAGDFTKFCSMLVAQPFKPASVRAILPREAYERCFEIVERKNVEGHPIVKLRKAGAQFSR